MAVQVVADGCITFINEVSLSNPGPQACQLALLEKWVISSSEFSVVLEFGVTCGKNGSTDTRTIFGQLDYQVLRCCLTE